MPIASCEYSTDPFENKWFYSYFWVQPLLRFCQDKQHKPQSMQTYPLCAYFPRVFFSLIDFLGKISPRSFSKNQIYLTSCWNVYIKLTFHLFWHATFCVPSKKNLRCILVLIIVEYIITVIVLDWHPHSCHTFSHTRACTRICMARLWTIEVPSWLTSSITSTKKTTTNKTKRIESFA